MKKNHVDKCIVIADSWPDSKIGTRDELVSLFPRTENTNVFVAGGISPIKNFDESFEKLLRYAAISRLLAASFIQVMNRFISLITSLKTYTLWQSNIICRFCFIQLGITLTSGMPMPQNQF